MNTSSKDISFIGVMSALMFVVLFLETYVFQVLIPLAPPCFLSLSMAIVISFSYGKKTMCLGGTILGVCSFFIAIIVGNPVFILPWISILPRVFIGIIAYIAYIVTTKITKNSQKDFIKNSLPYSVGAIFGVLTNTVLVLSVMYLFGKTGMEEILAIFMAINFPLEIVLSAVLVPILMNIIKKVRK